MQQLLHKQKQFYCVVEFCHTTKGQKAFTCQIFFFRIVNNNGLRQPIVRAHPAIVVGQALSCCALSHSTQLTSTRHLLTGNNPLLFFAPFSSPSLKFYHCDDIMIDNQKYHRYFHKLYHRNRYKLGLRYIYFISILSPFMGIVFIFILVTIPASAYVEISLPYIG